MKRFDTLNDDEQRNELLKGIYNQLAAMNKWLEVIAVSYAKLRASDVLEMQINTEHIQTTVAKDPDSRIGYTHERGLYITEYANGNPTAWPMGDDEYYHRTAPLDEYGGFADFAGD